LSRRPNAGTGLGEGRPLLEARACTLATDLSLEGEAIGSSESASVVPGAHGSWRGWTAAGLLLLYTRSPNLSPCVSPCLEYSSHLINTSSSSSLSYAIPALNRYNGSHTEQTAGRRRNQYKSWGGGSVEPEQVSREVYPPQPLIRRPASVKAAEPVGA